MSASATSSCGRMAHLLAQAKSFEDEYAAEQFAIEYNRIVSSGPSSHSTTAGVKRPRDGRDEDATTGANADAGGAFSPTTTAEDLLSHYGLLDANQAGVEATKMDSEIKALLKKRTILRRSLKDSRKEFQELDANAKHTKGVEMATEMTSVNGTLVAAPKNHEITHVYKKMQEEREAVVRRIEADQSALITVDRDINRLKARGQERRGILEGLVQLCEQAPMEDGTASSNNNDRESGDTTTYQLPLIEKDSSISANDIAAGAASVVSSSRKTGSSSSSAQQFHKGNPYGKTVLVIDPAQSVLCGKGPSLSDRPVGSVVGKRKDAAAGGGSAASSTSGVVTKSAEDTANMEALNQYRTRLDGIARLRRQAGFMAMSPLERVRAEMEAVQVKRNKFHRSRE